MSEPRGRRVGRGDLGPQAQQVEARPGTSAGPGGGRVGGGQVQPAANGAPPVLGGSRLEWPGQVQGRAQKLGGGTRELPPRPAAGEPPGVAWSRAQCAQSPQVAPGEGGSGPPAPRRPSEGHPGGRRASAAGPGQGPTQPVWRPRRRGGCRAARPGRGRLRGAARHWLTAGPAPRQHYLCWSDVPVPRISVIFSLEELKEVEKDCAVYVGRMERVARHSSVSKEEKVRDPSPGLPWHLPALPGRQPALPLPLGVSVLGAGAPRAGTAEPLGFGGGEHTRAWGPGPRSLRTTMPAARGACLVRAWAGASPGRRCGPGEGTELGCDHWRSFAGITNGNC